MGRRGPAPLPSALKRLHGETRPSRLNDREPLPRRTAPRPPADLDPAAKAIWRRTVREMPAGVITAVDADALACYCEAVVRYRQGQPRSWLGRRPSSAVRAQAT